MAVKRCTMRDEVRLTPWGRASAAAGGVAICAARSRFVRPRDAALVGVVVAEVVVDRESEVGGRLRGVERPRMVVLRRLS